MEKYFEQPSCVGVEQPRAYYVPFGEGEDPFASREKSSKFTSLNGLWNIREYKSFYDVPENFAECDVSRFDEVDVPSSLQVHGFDQIAYNNMTYPIPFNPPYVPNVNPTYQHERTFEVKKNAGERFYIVFEGVDSCFYLYINGKFVGFSQIAHRVSEFDVTDFVKDGENRMDVLVLKWCMGTYLEDQDKFRFTGIIRDVYMLTRTERALRSYEIKTKINGEVAFTPLGADAEIELDGKTAFAGDGETAVIKIDEPKLWSAETPDLYNLVIRSGGEVIGEKVGLREVKIEGGVLKLNGQPIKFHGVNRHDFNHIYGATVTLDDMRRDLTLMKKTNIDAIRTSHYPSCPEFYKMCDEYGFYVISESDVETHGTTLRRPGLEYYDGMNRIADDPSFESAIVERQKCNVISNYNRPCVVIWSLGNESGYGVNFERAAAWIKSVDLSRPVHYEGVQAVRNRGDEYYTANLDMVSVMYPSFEWLNDAYLGDKRETRPLVLCEYEHFMGNGPGNLKEYWDFIDAQDRVMGAFVWEFADHGIMTNEEEGLGYGGDYGETLHDGTFCIDGIFTGDRRITAKSFELKAVYSPIQITKEDGKLKLFSRAFFKTIKGTLELAYGSGLEPEIRENYDVEIKPRETLEFELTSDLNVVASFVSTEDLPLLGKGFEIARAGFENPIVGYEGDRINPFLTKRVDERPVFEEDARYIKVSEGGKVYTLDKTDGSIKSIKIDRQETLASPFRLNVWRAPICNDRNIVRKWRELRMFEALAEVRKTTIAGNVVSFEGDLCSRVLEPLMEFRLEYEFYNQGVSVHLDYEFADFVPWVPRIGFFCRLDKEFEDVKYYGCGPFENYVDRRFAAIKNYYEDSVTTMEEYYTRPQENGNRTDCNMCEITDGKRAFRVEGRFSFSALPHSPEEYEKSPHTFELPAREYTNVCVDLYQSGLGSNSCGPEPLVKYRTPAKGFGGFDIIVK